MFSVCERAGSASGSPGVDERRDATYSPRQPTAAADQQRTANQRTAGHTGWTQHCIEGYH